MALKKKKQSPQEKIRNLIRNPATWLVAFVLLFATYHYGSIWIEKRQFEKLDKQAYQYIQSIAKIYPGSINEGKICQYSSAKYSNGALGCLVEHTLVTKMTAEPSTIILYVPKQWGAAKDITDWSGKEDNVKRGLLFFDKNNPNCSIIYRFVDNHSIIKAECSGSARAEHYPVREY